MTESLRPSIEPDTPRPSPLTAGALALLGLVIVLVGVVGFGLGYVAGRDQMAYVHASADGAGLDGTVARDDLVRLLARIDVADAPDLGVSELRFPAELQGRALPRVARTGGPLARYVIDFGPVPPERVDHVLAALRIRGLHAEALAQDDVAHIVVGSFGDPVEASQWLTFLEGGSEGLGLGPPRVVPDPR